jgi:hypothetical protein
LLIARGRDEQDSDGRMLWTLTRRDLVVPAATTAYGCARRGGVTCPGG